MPLDVPPLHLLTPPGQIAVAPKELENPGLVLPRKMHRAFKAETGLWLPAKPAILPGLIPLAPAAAAADASKVLTFRGSAADSGNQTTYADAEFQGLDIGAADSSRRVIVVCSGGILNRTISSATIGGVTATKIVELVQGSATIAILIAHVPTGTTMNFSVTWSGGQSRCGIAWWTATGLTSDTAHDTETSIANPGAVTISTLNGGFMIAAAYNNSIRTYAWTDATERFELDEEGGAHLLSGADAATVGGNLTVTATYSGTTDVEEMVAASW